MAQRKTILIIDDDPELRGALAEQLQLHEEFTAIEADAAGEGIRMAREARPDLVLLDVDLPDMDGREACRLMRKNGVTAPIIMLTAADSDSDTILGLDSGANDYVTNPSGRRALPLRAQLRSLRLRGPLLAHRPYDFRSASDAYDQRGQHLRLIRRGTQSTGVSRPRRRQGGVARGAVTNVWGYTPGRPPTSWKPRLTACARRCEHDPTSASILLRGRRLPAAAYSRSRR